MRSLSQAVTAELIDKPTAWLRDNANRACRNADGSYDAQALVGNLLKSAPVAALPDDQLEAVRQVVECVHPYGDRHDLCLAALMAVEHRHGSAGLAAIGAELVRHFKLWCERDHFAQQRYAKIVAAGGVSHEPKPLFICERCEKFRLGDKWSPLPLPDGYVAHKMKINCDKCRR